MKTIRVFVSSPGDVQAERTIADRLIRTVAEELAIPVSVQYSNLLRNGEAVGPPNGPSEAESGELVLCPYFWEYQRFSPEMGYQDQIPNTAQFDLVISILWSRLGTKLHPRFQMPDGSEPRSGTEFEIAWAKAQHKKTPGVPALHVYRNRSQPNPPLDPPAVREDFFRQWDSLKGFFESWEKDSEGQFVGAFNNYNNLEEFERLFREHFRDFLATQISSERSRQWLATRGQVRRWKENPFRGLQSFDFEHAPIFAGRTLAIDGVLTALTQQAEAGNPFVLVLGASGSGKSSLVRAGVLPLLVEPGVVEGIGLWRRAVMRPGAGGSQSDMFDALAAGLLAQEALPELADLESKEPVKDLAAELRANPQGVADRVKDKLNQVASEYRLRQEQRLRELESGFREQKREADAENARLQHEKLEPPRARLALVVDQLEELFTSGFSEELQLKFVNAVSMLGRSGRVFVLVTLRNDFYARYQQFTDLVEIAKPSGKYDLQPPTPQEIGRMIRLPAQAAGLEFERDEAVGQTLDEALRDSAAADPQALPLLEHVLTRLYELQDKRGDRILSWSDYRKLGEMNGALANHAEEVFGTLGPDEQATFPLVMGYLVTLGQGEEEVSNRRTAPYNDFLGSADAEHDPKAGAKGFVDRFIEKRLLVADTDPHGEIIVSVAHEALLREWARVKSWLTENREFLRMRDRLDSSLRLWLSRGKQKDDLLGPGLPVAEGERLLTEFAPSLSQEEMDYIKASTTERKRQEQARARQFQIAAAVLFVLLCAASVGAYLAFTGRTEAERQREVARHQKTEAEKQREEAQKQAEEARMQREVATKQTEEAERQKNRAQQQTSVAEERTLALRKQLREASWASFNQAERQFQMGAWREGVALLARSIKFNPENEVASERFFQELITHHENTEARLLETFGHRGPVLHAGFNPNGSQILTASSDHTAKLWDAVSGKLLSTFDDEDSVNYAVFSPDGSRVLTANEDHTAKLWESTSGKLLLSFQHQGAVKYAAFSPDGSHIVTTSEDHTAKLWNSISGELQATFQHDDLVLDAVFSSDGSRILTRSQDQRAKLWESASGRLLASFEQGCLITSSPLSTDGTRILTVTYNGVPTLWDATSFENLGSLQQSTQSQSPIACASFSPDGSRVLTARSDGTAQIWDAVSNKLVTSLKLYDSLIYASFSPDGLRILSVSDDNTVRLWDSSSGKLLAAFGHQDSVLYATFSPDGSHILSACIDGIARLWDASSGKRIVSFEHRAGIVSASFSQDGSRILTGSDDHTAGLWDVASGKLLASLDHQGAVRLARFSPDGSRILTATYDEPAKLWDAATGKLLATFDDIYVNCAAFSPDGSRVLIGCSDHTARLRDATSGRLLASFEHRGFAGQGAVLYVTFNSNGSRMLTTSDDNTAKLWDSASGKRVASFRHQGPVVYAGFSSDGLKILTASRDGTAKLWEIASGKLLRSFQHQGIVNSAIFSCDDLKILTASDDHTAKLWDADSGKLLASFEHHDAVEYASFSPDGSHVLTASNDRTAKLCDVASGKVVASFEHQDAIKCAAFSPNGAYVLTAGGDHMARLWDVKTPVLLAHQIRESHTNLDEREAASSPRQSIFSLIESISEVASGFEFAGDGSLLPVYAERRSELAKQIQIPTQAQPMALFVRWLATSSDERTIFPASDVTVSVWLDNAVLTNAHISEFFTRDALDQVPDHPLLHIALAGFETDPIRAAFLRSFASERLPKNDPNVSALIYLDRK